MIKLKKHLGVILEPSKQGFDIGASTFGCLFKDPDDRNYYFYYTGSSEGWTKASIGVAKSLDGIRFVKYTENPLISLGNECRTPALFKAADKYWMAFAFRLKTRDRRLGIAVADHPLGPWRFVKELIKPKYNWEGNSIDIGPSIVNLNQEEYLVFYSNITNKRFLRLIFGPRYWYRRIGVLKLRISETKGITAERWIKNPLTHLNGIKGMWNESLFCPGYYKLDKRHYFLPVASTYTVPFPYKQYIGLLQDSSPFFENATTKCILINGPEEKSSIMPSIESEIALDSPSPLVLGKELWLYYSVMDRADGIWKTALSIFTLKRNL